MIPLPSMRTCARNALCAVIIFFGFQSASAQTPVPDLSDAESGAPIEFLQLEWTANDGTLSCREQTFQIPFDAQFTTPPGQEPMPEWFSDGPGGFSLPSYRLELQSSGSYRVETSLSIDDQRIEVGLWTINEGELSFSCPEVGCDFTPPGSVDVVKIDSPDSLPQLQPYAEHLGGPDIAFYSDGINSSRLVCGSSERLYKLRIPAAATTHPMSESDCDYRDAATNDGWGWDPVALQSCPPIHLCDYTDAEANGGWGWNATTSTSCPPL